MSDDPERALALSPAPQAPVWTAEEIADAKREAAEMAAYFAENRDPESAPPVGRQDDDTAATVNLTDLISDIRERLTLRKKNGTDWNTLEELTEILLDRLAGEGRQDGWQDIATAPYNKRILAASDDEMAMVWKDRIDDTLYYSPQGGKVTQWVPTMWRPIPDTPAPPLASAPAPYQPPGSEGILETRRLMRLRGEL